MYKTVKCEFKVEDFPFFLCSFLPENNILIPINSKPCELHQWRMIEHNDKYAKQNTKHKRKIGNSTILVSVVVVLVVVAVVNSHQLFPHTQVYVGIGLGADRSGMVDGRLPRAVARLRF